MMRFEETPIAHKVRACRECCSLKEASIYSCIDDAQVLDGGTGLRGNTVLLMLQLYMFTHA